ncbi:MAG: TIGR00730 family Rossman fold protein [Pelolinea sp.]|nr:TIGR00730 family Rossman fold protein [Pelolinea sp.]
MTMQSVCVYCGSSPGRSSDYLRAAKDLGAELGRRRLTLVYGGSGVGLMGEVARSAIEAGGKVVGVIPQALAEQKIAFEGLADLRVVKDMHERKAVMAELSDGFIALPGGYGTYEEFFEALTWLQLGIHTKPCGLMNVNGYYDKLLEFLDHAVDELFIHKPHRDLILSSDQPGALLDQFMNYQPVRINKTEWVHQMADWKQAHPEG